MNARFLSESVVSGILEDGLPFAFSFGVVLSSDDFGDIGLNDSPPSMVYPMNGSGSNGGASSRFSLFFWRGPVDNVIPLLETWDGVTFGLRALILLPGRPGLCHCFFAGETVLCGVFCDELIPGFGHRCAFLKSAQKGLWGRVPIFLLYW